MGVITRIGTVEYVEEVTFDNTPTNPTMLWIGRIESCKLNIKPTLEPVKALKPVSFTGTRLSPDLVAKTGQEITADIIYYPQDWTFIQYALWNGTIDTTAPVAMSAMTDALKSVSLGFKSTDSTPKFAKIGGFKLGKVVVDFQPKGLAKVTANLKGAMDNASSNNPWAATDYIGSGSHAAASTVVPLSFKNIKSVTWGGSAISNAKLSGVKMEIDRKLEDIYDTDETNSTKTGDFVPSETSLKVTVNIKKGAIDPLTADIISAQARNLVITVTGNEGSPVDQVFTFKNMVIPEDLVEFAGSGLSSLDVIFENGTDLALS